MQAIEATTTSGAASGPAHAPPSTYEADSMSLAYEESGSSQPTTTQEQLLLLHPSQHQQQHLTQDHRQHQASYQLNEQHQQQQHYEQLQPLQIVTNYHAQHNCDDPPTTLHNGNSNPHQHSVDEQYLEQHSHQHNHHHNHSIANKLSVSVPLNQNHQQHHEEELESTAVTFHQQAAPLQTSTTATR